MGSEGHRPSIPHLTSLLTGYQQIQKKRTQVKVLFRQKVQQAIACRNIIVGKWKDSPSSSNHTFLFNKYQQAPLYSYSSFLLMT